MITQDQGNKIKEILGKDFMDLILEALAESKVTTRKKTALSVPYISLILKGERSHEKAEKVIWNRTERMVQEKEQENKRQLKIFERFDSLKHE